LPSSYTGKIPGSGKTKNLGCISFDALLGALGVALVVIGDKQAMEPIAGRLSAGTVQPCDTKQPQPEAAVKKTPASQRDAELSTGRLFSTVQKRKVTPQVILPGLHCNPVPRRSPNRRGTFVLCLCPCGLPRSAAETSTSGGLTGTRAEAKEEAPACLFPRACQGLAELEVQRTL
jgi:hypothetical protein